MRNDAVMRGQSYRLAAILFLATAVLPSWGLMGRGILPLLAETRPQHPGPIQFTHSLLAEYHPYPIEIALPTSPVARPPHPNPLAQSTTAIDLPVACSAWLADKSPSALEQVQACLAIAAPRPEARWLMKRSISPSPNADADSDRAALWLLLGKPDQALPLITSVLLTRPDHQAAQWNRALALQDLGLTWSAAATFERIEARGIPGWSKEAGARAAALRHLAEMQRRSYEEVRIKGHVMVAGGPGPLELAQTVPASLRQYFYDAVHARQAIAPDTLGATAQEDYFAKLRTAGQEDLLLGALLLTGRVHDHLAEYQALALKSGDPWFIMLGENERARAEMARGDHRHAEEYLLAVLKMCKGHGLASPCAQTEALLARLYLSSYALHEAEAHTQAGLALARQSGDQTAETLFLEYLFELSRLRNDRPLAAAYLAEIGSRHPEDCQRQRHVHEDRAFLQVYDLRFEEARREILEAPLCGESRSLTSLAVLAELARARMPVVAPAELRADLVALRRQRNLSPGEQAFVEYLEGLLLLQQAPEEGRLHLRQAIATTQGLHSLDAKAWQAQVHSYEELSLAAGKSGDPNGALTVLAEQAGIPLPDQCVLGAVVAGERSLVVVRDRKGGAHLRYEGQRANPNIDVRLLVPYDLKFRLAGCSRIDVLASSLLRARSALLPSIFPWVIRAWRHGPLGPVHCEGHRLEVQAPVPPPDPQLPGFPRARREPLSSLGRAPVILRGATATPPMVLKALPTASEILIAAPVFAADGVTSLILSEGQDKKRALAADGLQRAELKCAPLAALILWPTEAAALEPHEPWNLADTLSDRGARAVFVVTGPVPASEYREFFDVLFARIQAGTPAPEALRQQRSTWKAWIGERKNDWTEDIVLYE